MIVESFFDEGLGNSSYLLAAAERRTAVAIDPQRDVDRYLDLADRRGWRIGHVLETHLHADFVSGSRELAARTGATVLASAEASLAFVHQPLRDGEVFNAGGLDFQVLATPGHTPEHLAFLLLSRDGRPKMLFSGGALLPGSAARTDLIAPHLTESLTRALYHSLHERILTLPDFVPVHPTHGAGSFCAAGVQDKRSTTIGDERRSNPLVAAANEDAFVARALRDLSAYPDYFLRMRAVNQSGPTLLGSLPKPAPLSALQVSHAMMGGAVLLDTRPSEAFDAGHIPSSYGIPLSPSFGTWAGWILPAEARLLLLTESDQATADVVRQMIRVGFERFEGYLAGGLSAWQAEGNETVSIPRIPVEAVQNDGRQIVDVREAAEWRAGHVPGALSVPMSQLRQRLGNLPQQPLLVHCAQEFRSTIGASILERAGFQVSHLVGGFEAWGRAGKPVQAALHG